jgi:predicted amidophosphoribosyltransferase
MALIQCPDCANSVSDQAELCRHCGRPIKNSISIRLEKEEIELDLFDPYEAKSMRTQIMKNESSLLQAKTKDKAALKKKKNQERMG